MPDTEEVKKNEKVIEKFGLKIDTLSDRVKHCVKSTFNGKRIVIFSGGPAKGRDAVLEEIQQVAEGGSFGSIVGRNSFQRPSTNDQHFILVINRFISLDVDPTHAIKVKYLTWYVILSLKSHVFPRNL